MPITPASSASASTSPAGSSRPFVVADFVGTAPAPAPPKAKQAKAKPKPAPAKPNAPSPLTVASALRYARAANTELPHSPYVIEMLKSGVPWKRLHMLATLKAYFAQVAKLPSTVTPAERAATAACFEADECCVCMDHVYAKSESNTKPEIGAPCGHVTCDGCWCRIGLNAPSTHSTSHLKCPKCRDDVSEWYKSTYVTSLLSVPQQVHCMARFGDGDEHLDPVQFQLAINWWKGTLTARAVTHGIVNPNYRSSSLSASTLVVNFDTNRGAVMAGTAIAAGTLVFHMNQGADGPLVLSVRIEGGTIHWSQPCQHGHEPPYCIQMHEAGFEVYSPLRVREPALMKRKRVRYSDEPPADDS